ncbi:predicted protein [Nematostella vectensis]|uniref:G-protein coupled receptors family 1 profile domain-containing protein n=1 Tax=Nematostella vectensis TaxID=45351 RepID=A7SA66_NEMVE|nr:neuropeptide S receptor [Nematostella vectensis]EDO39404.1 predicted protein [Nematostella vectensis]|eukprot:XP_001631467.1 predicted protein [Nematostella vectensis]
MEIDDESFVVGKTVILVLILLVSITGNFLVCYCGVHSQRMSAMNHIIVNLAVSEIVIAVVAIPIKIERGLDGDLVSGSPFCKLFEYVQSVALGAAVMSLLMLSVDRYCSVFHPLSKITRRQAKHMIVFSWCYPLLFSSPVLYYVLGATHQPAALLLQCEQDFNQDFTQLDKMYSLIQLWLNTILPVLAVTIAYVIITSRLLRTGKPHPVRVAKVGVSPKKTPGYPGPIHRSYTTAMDSNIVPVAKRRAVVMNLIVMSTYLFCWTPLVSLYITRTFYDFRFDVTLQTLHDLSSFLALAKLCINPAIYSFFDSAIRDQLCRCRKRNVEQVAHASERCTRGKLSELNVSKIGLYQMSVDSSTEIKEPLLCSGGLDQRLYKTPSFNTDKLVEMIANTRRYRSMGMFTSRSSNI